MGVVVPLGMSWGRILGGMRVPVRMLTLETSAWLLLMVIEGVLLSIAGLR